MFSNGFMDEVKSLLAKGYPPTLPTMSAIGYRECVQVIEGRITLEQAKQLIRRTTRVFVRRQANWFKETDREIAWFRVEEGVVENMDRFIRRALDDPASVGGVPNMTNLS
jgi:tRNA dimethylallyltransferase